MNCDCTNKEECQKDCKTAETVETAEHNGFDCWIEDMKSCDKDDCENCDC